MVLLKKFLMALAIALYSVVPVVASDNDRVRGHWQGHGAKMLNLKVHQQTPRGYLKKADLEGMWASVQDIRLAKKRLRIAFQSSAGEEGLISRHKRKYQIGVGRSLTQHQQLLEGVPSQRFRRSQNKDPGIRKGYGRSWGQHYGKNSNKHCGIGGDKGAGKRGDQSRGHKWQKNRKKKSFDSD